MGITVLVLVSICALAAESFAGFDAIQRRVYAPPGGFYVVNIHPHNVSSFTEGLLFDRGMLLESTGLDGQSYIREIDARTGLSTGKEFKFPPDIFGEGITVLGNTIYALTYQAKKGFAINRDSFKLLRSFDFETNTGEGWGMTTDQTHLIVSDGSSTIYFFDQKSMAKVREITVTNNGQPVININELEYVRDELFANVWLTTNILRIDPISGNVKEVLKMERLQYLESNVENIRESWRKVDAVMNGIAFNPENNHLYVTGKLWDAVFELQVALASDTPHVRTFDG
ncbi:hypothetical protein THRCLA_21050 [Thraustotheca clavata]|uniref:Glutamine cyclotransferase n=1 Tax=Thraustotheca clavata TaxID=74557 RepID=A0A1W0A0Q2_9STRA|nr:hypothetical protein THRCLA_21050 [Thraustotheca clavata]